MTQRIPYAAWLVASVLFSGSAHGEITGTVKFDNLSKLINGKFTKVSTDEEINALFNRARCLCEKTKADDLEIDVSLVDFSGESDGDKVILWAGKGCDTASTSDLSKQCKQLPDPIDIKQSKTKVTTIPFNPKDLLFPDTECGEISEERTIAGIAGDKSLGARKFVVDTIPPPAVGDPELVGIEGGLQARWSVPSGTSEAIRYQLVCFLEKNGAALFETPKTPIYEISQTLCDVDDPTLALSFDGNGATTDAGTGSGSSAANFPANVLEDIFVCSGEIAKGSTQALIDLTDSEYDLESQDLVHVLLVEVDDHDNAHVVDLGAAKPEPSLDFWEVYGANGGGAEGGFCFVATAAYGSYDHPFVQVLRDFRDGTLAEFGLGRSFIDWYYRHSPTWAEFLRAHSSARTTARVLLWPVVFLAGAWEYTTVLGKLLTLFGLFGIVWLRRRRESLPWPFRRIAIAAGVATLVCLAGARSAMAQVVYEADGSLATEYQTERRSTGVFEIKFGPYRADVDSEPGLAPQKPYRAVFGTDDSLAIQLEFDRFVWYPAGQLGVAVMVGYTKDSASAIAQDPTTGQPVYTRRAEGDETAFHLIPTALSAVYRFTYLADKTVIPLVPYAKLGLSYYLWWITKGDGSIATMEANGDPDNKARGGTLGWQGTVGLSFRADALDTDAAKNQETEWGIEHTGFFAEMTKAKVNGLKEHKLNVGDTTWFAGVNFEF